MTPAPIYPVGTHAEFSLRTGVFCSREAHFRNNECVTGLTGLSCWKELEAFWRELEVWRLDQGA